MYKKEHQISKAPIISSLYRKECDSLILFNHIFNQCNKLVRRWTDLKFVAYIWLLGV